jgi:polyphosphate kinase
MSNKYEHLLVAPFNMKARFLYLIDREMAHVKTGKEGLIIAKMNSMEEVDITEKLYEASKAGVKVILIIRGFCTLKPQVPGLSENIQVISVVGRFLEHSRLFYFRNGQEKKNEGEFFLGSADWMYRNLNNRVEVITPVISQELKNKCWHFIETILNDQRLAWEMQADGSYKQRKPKDEVETSTHELLMQEALKSVSSIPGVTST